MYMKPLRLILLLLSIVLLSVFAYRAYVEQEGRAQLLTGTVEATRVEVGVKESGYIEELFLHEGMEVHAGDVAARIGRRDLMAARLRSVRAPTMHAVRSSSQRAPSHSRRLMPCVRRVIRRMRICTHARRSSGCWRTAAAPRTSEWQRRMCGGSRQSSRWMIP